MKATVDKSLCIGCGLCADACPEVFEMDDDNKAQAKVNPVPPERLFSLVQAGYAADLILQLSLESLNGLRNQPLTLGSEYQADPEFFRVLLDSLRYTPEVRSYILHGTGTLFMVRAMRSS